MLRYKSDYADLGFKMNDKGYADVLHTDLNELIQGYDNDILELEKTVMLFKSRLESLKSNQIEHHTKILKTAKELCERGMVRCEKNDFAYALYYKCRYADRLKTIQQYADKYGIDLSDKEQTE